MQFFVLGAPRSGTSVTARLLTLMGCQFGPPHQSVGASSSSPMGTWERRDVRQINRSLMQISGSTWNKVALLEPESLDGSLDSTERRNAAGILTKFDATKPAMLKDIRFSFLLRSWLAAASDPAAVIVYRHPVAAARAMHIKNQIPLHVGIALWEHYMVAALNSSREIPRLIVPFDTLAAGLSQTADKLRQDLESLGANALDSVREQTLNEYFDENLIHHRCGPIESTAYLSASQFELNEALADQSILDLSSKLDVSDESKDVLAAYEAEKEWLDTSLETERKNIRSQLDLLQNKLSGYENTSKELLKKRDDALLALSAARTEAAALRSDARLQGAELKSTTAQLELQEDKLRIAANLLERASEHYAALTKTRRWRFLSGFAKVRRLLSGRESRFEKSVREMKELEKSLRSFLPSIGAPVKAIEVRTEGGESKKPPTRKSA